MAALWKHQRARECGLKRAWRDLLSIFSLKGYLDLGTDESAVQGYAVRKHDAVKWSGESFNI